MNIYSNFETKLFLKQLLPAKNFIIKEFDEILNEENINQDGIIFLKNESRISNFKFSVLKKKYLIITNINTNIKISKKNITLLKTPQKPDLIKSEIIKFISNNKVFFEDICLFDNKLAKINEKKYCFLTDIEFEILSYLINDNNCTKEYIKNNILNIKSSIETNSVDSHLSRIRKKLIKINSNLVIQSKNDKVKFSSIKEVRIN